MKFTCVSTSCKRRGREVETSKLNPVCVGCGRLLAGPTRDVNEYMQGRSYRFKRERA